MLIRRAAAVIVTQWYKPSFVKYFAWMCWIVHIYLVVILIVNNSGIARIDAKSNTLVSINTNRSNKHLEIVGFRILTSC
jgi:hypothetical protein